MITTGRIADVRKILDDARGSGCPRSERVDGRTVGFVPTMGALHEGHRSLMRRARREASCVVVSIFVNPTQFGPHEDLAAYPRPIEADLEACEAEGVDVVFNPEADEIYPEPVRTTVSVTGLTERMEGAHRPGHFDGVTLVCSKLFNIVGPCSAYLGEKDAQQLRVVAKMARDLDLPVDIVPCPTIRDPDGLALSSRNIYLSADERERALFLPRALDAIGKLADCGETSSRTLIQAGRDELERGADQIDYLEIVDPRTLEPLERVDQQALVCVAIRIGRTRLIDNITLGGNR